MVLQCIQTFQCTLCLEQPLLWCGAIQGYVSKHSRSALHKLTSDLYCYFQRQAINPRSGTHVDFRLVFVTETRQILHVELIMFVDVAKSANKPHGESPQKAYKSACVCLMSLVIISGTPRLQKSPTIYMTLHQCGILSGLVLSCSWSLCHSPPKMTNVDPPTSGS